MLLEKGEAAVFLGLLSGIVADFLTLSQTSPEFYVFAVQVF